MCVVGCAFFSRALWVRGASSGLGRSVLSAHRWRGGRGRGRVQGRLLSSRQSLPCLLFFSTPLAPVSRQMKVEGLLDAQTKKKRGGKKSDKVERKKTRMGTRREVRAFFPSALR